MYVVFMCRHSCLSLTLIISLFLIILRNLLYEICYCKATGLWVDMTSIVIRYDLYGHLRQVVKRG